MGKLKKQFKGTVEQRHVFEKSRPLRLACLGETEVGEAMTSIMRFIFVYGR